MRILIESRDLMKSSASTKMIILIKKSAVAKRSV